MRFNFPSYDEELQQQKQWHRKFAWWPTRVEGVIVLGEYYERRIVNVISNWAGTDIQWEYRLYDSPGKDAM